MRETLQEEYTGHKPERCFESTGSAPPLALHKNYQEKPGMRAGERVRKM
jgi:hypothetical protein